MKHPEEPWKQGPPFDDRPPDGRPPFAEEEQKEEEKICFAIIGLFDSPKKNQIIN